jgi:hypothetical protein
MCLDIKLTSVILGGVTAVTTPWLFVPFFVYHYSTDHAVAAAADEGGGCSSQFLAGAYYAVGYFGIQLLLQSVAGLQ